MNEENVAFIHTEIFLHMQKITEQSNPLWGKMNAQQMVEHLADIFNVSTEQIIFPLVTAEEQLPKYREFLYSDKEFRENTKAPVVVLGEDPLPLRTASLQEAKANLKATVEIFFRHFEKDIEKKTMHPSFGMLNFDEWLILHAKHVRHHLRQFGVTF